MLALLRRLIDELRGLGPDFARMWEQHGREGGERTFNIRPTVSCATSRSRSRQQCRREVDHPRAGPRRPGV
jgi:hypothetical protein